MKALTHFPGVIVLLASIQAQHLWNIMYDLEAITHSQGAE